MALLKQSPLEPLLDRLGNANPQLLRELRGRLKPGPVLGTLVVSIASQAIYALNRLSELPSATPPPAYRSTGYHHLYCLIPASGPNLPSNPGCQATAPGSAIPWQVNWPLWWADSLTHWSLWMGSIAIVLSCYLLVADWCREEERGTFNPLRLSPQSTDSILWGKLMGVPILVYLFGLSTLPLQLMAMVGAGRSVSDILASQLIGLAQYAFWVMTSLFVANLLGPIGRGAKAILAAIIVSGALLCSLQVASVRQLGQDYGLHGLLGLLSPALVLHHDGVELNALGTYIDSLLHNAGGWSLFGWYFGRSTPSLALVVSLIFFGWSYVCGLALVRRFDRPSATLWSKGQSYAITAMVTAFVLGAFQFEPQNYGYNHNDFLIKNWLELTDQSAGILNTKYTIKRHIINSLLPLFWLLLPLGLSLVQSRQGLLDWVHRPVGVSPESRSARQSAHRFERLWGDQYPPFMALGVHVAIVFTGIVLYWGITLHGVSNATLRELLLSHNGLGGGLLLTNLWLLLIFMVQLIQLRLRRGGGFWSVGAIAIGLFGIPTLLALPLGLRSIAGNSLELLTFSPFNVLAANEPGLIIAILCGQWLGLALIYRQFDRSLRQLSRSEFAAALSPTSTPTSVS
jgi:hypothetical protein